MRIISIEHLDSCKLIRVEHDGVKYINHDFHEPGFDMPLHCRRRKW